MPYAGNGEREDGRRIDPRTFTLELDGLLPVERVVRSTRETSWATRACSCPCRTSAAFCFTQAFQSVGLGLATAIGAALAQPVSSRVAALGDGGALMGVAELETVVRLGCRW